jgi:hypothetical protein
MGTLVFYLFHEHPYEFKDIKQKVKIFKINISRKRMKLIKKYIAKSFIKMLNGKQRILGIIVNC